MITKLFLLLCGHALADFALQSETMAKGKNRNKKPDYIPEGQKYVPCWPYWLTAHALIHGGIVYLITQTLWCGIVETIAHWWIDFLKCENKTTPNEDQLYHFLFKILYLFS